MSLLHEARRALHLPHREEEKTFSKAEIKEQTCVLLPRDQLPKAREIVRQAWAAQQPIDELERRLLLIKRQGLVGAFRIREREVPGNPEQVIFYPYNPYVSDEDIAARCGGEVGIVRTDIHASALMGFSNLLERVRPIIGEDRNDGIVSSVKPWRNEAGADGIYVAVGIEEVLRGQEPFPAFGEQKDAMLGFKDRIVSALGTPL